MHKDFWHWSTSSRSFINDFTIKLQRYGISFCVHSTACTVLDGFFSYLAQMPTSLRGYVAHNEFGLWSLYSRSFRYVIVMQLNCSNMAQPFMWALQCFQLWMNSFHIWQKQLSPWWGVLHVLTFDLTVGYYKDISLLVQKDLYNVMRSFGFHSSCEVECTTVLIAHKMIYCSCV